MTGSSIGSTAGNTPGTSEGWNRLSDLVGSLYESWPETDPQKWLLVFVRRWPGETAASRRVNAESAAGRSLAAKELGGDQLHAGEHCGVLAGRGDDGGEQASVFLPNGGLQRLAWVGDAGEPRTVGNDRRDVSVE